MRRLCLSIVLAVVATLLIVVPALAAYYAYIHVEETDGNSYDNLPLICSTNVTQLVRYGFVTSTGLTSRVLTGSGYALPQHMLADDKILFVTDLGAYEDKTLIFYPKGATSLSSFPIIVGYGGSITTEDDPDLELSYVIQLLISGYFNADAEDVGKNILYKEDAFRVWISGANKLEVSGLESGGGEEWEMTYSSFTSGPHTVYILSNGLGAYLYVDDFDVAKDTVNLYEASNANLINTEDLWAFPYRHNTCYAQDKYWAFYGRESPYVFYKTSADGLSWSSEYSFASVGGDAVRLIDVFERGGYVYITYINSNSVEARYRRGLLNADSSITWSAAWQTVATAAHQMVGASIAVDKDGYPFVIYTNKTPGYDYNNYITKSSANDGTWVTAGGYPLTLTSNNGKEGVAIVSYLDSNKIYALYDIVSTLYGRYYNGSSWQTAEALASGSSYVYYNGVSDEDDNVYMVWEDGITQELCFKIRYADGTFSSTTQIVDADEHTYPSVAYNDDNGYVYIIYMRGGSVRCVTLAADTFTGEYTLFNPTGPWHMAGVTPYGDHIGLLYTTGSGGDTEHGFIQFPWDWNDNGNNWTWMQDNVMPYADNLWMAIDGEEVLQYQPDSIIQGTILPDETFQWHTGIINWGTNPDGVDVSISSLESDEQEGVYYYPYGESGSQDIIEPEPESVTTDVDLDRLKNNPLNPVAELIADASNGMLTPRLVWLAMAWLILIAAMLLVHLGPDTHKDSEKPQHFVLTSLTGLGLAALFYTMGVFALWVPILMAFGLIASIVYERMPVL